jgi:hypothetical protein
MFDINIFSGKVYRTEGNIKVAQDGTTFVKAGNDWIAPNGDFIQQMSHGLQNSRTAVNEAYGDPFGDSNG